MSDEPLTIEDEIAYDACSNLILCMMKDADPTRRVAEIKAMDIQTALDSYQAALDRYNAR